MAEKHTSAPVTRTQLIANLNEDLAREYQAIIAYIVYSQVIKGAEYMAIAKELEAHAGQEQGPPATGSAGRYAEGMVHGFLTLSTAAGEALGDGDLLQVHRGTSLDAHMIFHLRDSSYFDEHTVFTQRGAFVVQRYDLVQ